MSRVTTPFTTGERWAIFAIIMIWGLNNAAAKVATQVLPPMFVGGMRFAVTLLVLAPLLRPPLPPLRRMIPIVLLAGPLHFGLVYVGFAVGQQLSPLVVASQLWIPFVALFAWRMLGEKINAATAAGLVIAFVGVAWMTLDPHAKGDALGIALIALAAAVWALATVLVRKTPGIKPLKLQAMTAAVAAPVLLGASFAAEPGLIEKARAATPLIWLCVVWAGLASSVVATSLLFWLVQRREPGRVTPYFLLTPLVSCAIGVALMGDRLTAQLIGGGAATLVGVALVSLAERREELIARKNRKAAAVAPT